MSRYVAELQTMLDPLSHRAKIAFSLWCAEHLVNLARGVLTDLGEMDKISGVIEFLKCREADGKEADAESFRQLSGRLESIDFSKCDAIFSCNFGYDVVAIQATASLFFSLQVWQDNSAECAARAAEAVLNAYDRVLSERIGSNSNSVEVLNLKEMHMEVKKQIEAVAQLQSGFVPSSVLPARALL
ncbi:MAG: hypothetical protein U0744_08775 [Gemmataceae bacterium]